MWWCGTRSDALPSSTSTSTRTRTRRPHAAKHLQAESLLGPEIQIEERPGDGSNGQDEKVEEHCQDCHGEPGFVRGKQAEGMDEDELIEHYLNALHAQCINCHLEKKIEDRKIKIPIGCTQCHDRSALPAEK